MNRDSYGRLILDDFTPLEYNIIGKKEKKWLKKDDKIYLFKTGASNYEIYAELIASELAKQCGFNTAEYDLAIYDGKTGIITPSFLKMGDIIISGEKYLEYAKDIAIQNNIYLDFKENSIENIMNAIAFQDPNTDLDKFLLDILKLYIFDLTILESDRNKTNWSMIRDIYGNINLAPIYDCSTMARMNTNIDSLLTSLHNETQIFNIIDQIKFSLKLSNNSSDNHFEELSKLYEMFPNQVSTIIEGIKNINTNLAIENIENRINAELKVKNFTIPNSIKFWLNKTIMTRKEEIISIYNMNKRKSK